MQYFLAFQAEDENFYREYLKAQKEAEEYVNALYERVQDYVCKMKKEELCFFLIKMNYEKQKQSGGKGEQFRLFVLFVL